MARVPQQSSAAEFRSRVSQQSFAAEFCSRNFNLSAVPGFPLSGCSRSRQISS